MNDDIESHSLIHTQSVVNSNQLSFKSRISFFAVIWFVSFSFQVEPIFAQFNGNFEIRKHYLTDENPVDWKAYQLSKTRLYDWYNSQNGMLMTMGSLSLEHFYMESEARLTAEFGDYVSIMYNRTEESFYNLNPPCQEVELRVGGLFGLSFIGFPHHEKKYDNVGAAISLGNRWTWNYLRLSYLNQFFEYNDKNDNDDKQSVTDEYLKTPDMSRLEFQTFLGEHLLVKADLKQEHETKLFEKLSNETKTYSGYDYRGTLDLVFLNSWLIGITGRRDWEKRDILPDVTSDTLPDLDQTLDFRFGEVYFIIWISDDDQLSLGYYEQYYTNVIESSIDLQKYEMKTGAQQYWAKWETKTSTSFQWTFEVIAGKVHFYKDNLDRDILTDEITDQAKFKLGMTWIAGENAIFSLISSFDLDNYNERVWDGGGGNFMATF